MNVLMRLGIFFLSVFLITLQSCFLFINVPDAPLVLIAEAISPNEIRLDWPDSATNELGYVIERKKRGETEFKIITELSENSIGYIDSGLWSNTTYSYRVYAFNNVGNSGYSRIAEATTFAAIVHPSTPSGLSIQSISAAEIGIFGRTMLIMRTVLQLRDGKATRERI